MSRENGYFAHMILPYLSSVGSDQPDHANITADIRCRTACKYQWILYKVLTDCAGPGQIKLIR